MRTTRQNVGSSTAVIDRPSRQANININPESRVRIVTSVDAEDLRHQFGGDSPAPTRIDRIQKAPIKVEGYLIDRGPHRGIVFEYTTSLSAEWTEAINACTGMITLQKSTLGQDNAVVNASDSDKFKPSPSLAQDHVDHQLPSTRLRALHHLSSSDEEGSRKRSRAIADADMTHSKKPFFYSGYLPLSNEQQIRDFFLHRFDVIKSNPCKQIQMRIIEALVERKSAKYPYKDMNNPHRVVGPPPDIWPREVTWQGPDRLQHPGRLTVLVHLAILPLLDLDLCNNLLFRHMYCFHKPNTNEEKLCKRRKWGSWQGMLRYALLHGPAGQVELRDKATGGSPEREWIRTKRHDARIAVLDGIITMAGEVEAVARGEKDSNTMVRYEAVPEEVAATPSWGSKHKKRAKALKCNEHATAGRCPCSTTQETAEDAEQDTEPDTDDESPMPQQTNNSAGTTTSSHLHSDLGNDLTSATTSFGSTTSMPLSEMTAVSNTDSMHYPSQAACHVDLPKPAQCLETESSMQSASAARTIANARPSCRKRRTSTIVPDFKPRVTQDSPYDTGRQGRSSHRSDSANVRRSVSVNPADGIPWYTILGQHQTGIHAESQHVPGQQTPSLRYMRRHYMQDSAGSDFLYGSPTHFANEWHGPSSPQGYIQPAAQPDIEMMPPAQAAAPDMQPLSAGLEATAEPDYGQMAIDPRLISQPLVYQESQQSWPMLNREYETTLGNGMPTTSTFMGYPTPNPAYYPPLPQNHAYHAPSTAGSMFSNNTYRHEFHTHGHVPNGCYGYSSS